VVNVAKRRRDNRDAERKIKIMLVDHHENKGIPYKMQIEGEQEYQDEDDPNQPNQNGAGAQGTNLLANKEGNIQRSLSSQRPE